MGTFSTKPFRLHKPVAKVLLYTATIVTVLALYI